MDKYGADVLRLWVASVDYSQDVSISEEILKRTSDTYRRFRNTFRFLLGVLNDYSSEVALEKWEDLEPLDQWALVRLARLLDEVNEAYNNYKFHHVYRLIYDYVVGDLSAVYMDALKDRLYSDAPNAKSRRSAQTVLYNVLEVLVRLLTPITSFTTEEVWQNYPEGLANVANRPESVQLAGWPTHETFSVKIPEGANSAIEQRFAAVLEFRDEVTKALEEKRGEKLINKSQEANVVATVPEASYALLSQFDSAFFEELLIVSKVELQQGSEYQIDISVSELEKCPRCWNFRELGADQNHPDVCQRCANALSAME
jgi:isoleucyl-tRNA synthetase